MEIKVRRIKNNGDTTLGELLINNVVQCYTLEDQPNPQKVYGETRIPAGKYDVTLRKEGRMHEDYSKRFPDIHKGMLYIHPIPGFDCVYIHIGNTDDDTLGCILVGTSIDQQGWKLKESTLAYKKIYPQIANAILKGDKVTITVLDENAA